MLIDGNYNYNICLRRIADILAFKYEASKTEYMSLLINSLSHEMITPLTELLNLVTPASSCHLSVGSVDANPMVSPVNQMRKIPRTQHFTSVLGSLTNVRDDNQFFPQGSVTGNHGRDSSIGGSINQIGSRLVLFVQSLLTYSQIVNNKFELDAEANFNVSALLYDVSGLYYDKCQQKRIEVSVDCDKTLTIKADRKRLTCVILALLDNAIKFTSQPNKKITLKAELCQSSFVIIFKIIDMGIGINTRDLGILCRILKKPFSTEATSSSAGLGIGLRTAQAILSEVTNGIGEMQIVTSLGSGTTVSFEIPINKTQNGKKSMAQPDEIAELEINIEICLPDYKKERGLSQLRSENLEELGTIAKLKNPNNVDNEGEDLNFISMIAKNFVSLAGSKLSRLRIAQSCRTLPSRTLDTPRRLTKRLTKQEKTLLSIISRNGERPKILIVDDEVFLLEYLRDLLEEWDLDVYTANSPDAAIRLARMFVQLRIRISLVFMDYNMPGMNGCQCVKALKSSHFRPAFTLTKFTALTAQNDKMVKDGFRDVGVQNFIFKPYSFMDIKNHLVDQAILPAEFLD